MNAPRVPPTIAPLGRGGSQHQYLQDLIKRWAVSKGYRATIEQPIRDGMGSVDVALARGNLSIACEISVTTSADHEVGNVQKCLAAGFDHIVLITAESKSQAKLREAVMTAVGKESGTRVQVLTPEGFFDFVETLEINASGREENVHGYNVKVSYRKVAAGEEKAKRQAISQVIVDALKKLKKRDK